MAMARSLHDLNRNQEQFNSEVSIETFSGGGPCQSLNYNGIQNTSQDLVDAPEIKSDIRTTPPGKRQCRLAGPGPDTLNLLPHSNEDARVVRVTPTGKGDGVLLELGSDESRPHQVTPVTTLQGHREDDFDGDDLHKVDTRRAPATTSLPPLARVGSEFNYSVVSDL